MLRSGLSSSARTLLSRRIPSSSSKNGVDLMRHFVSADIVSTSNDNDSDRSSTKFQSKPQSFRAGSSIAIGNSPLIISSFQQMHNGSSNFTISKRSFWSRKAKPDDAVVETDFTTEPSAAPEAEAVPEAEAEAATSVVEQSTSDAAPVSAEEAMAKFEESADAAVAAADVASEWVATWYPSDLMISGVLNVHEMTGLNYALTIGAITIIFRSLMFPIFVKSQQNSSRMAHMKPEMDILKEKLDRLDKKDMVANQQAMQEFQALYRKYDVNPLRAIAVPFLQMPVFVSMFFGMREMPNTHPQELVDGGMLWFTDLTAADPTFILPVGCAVTFLLMTELGKEQMMASSSPEQAKMILTAFRGLAVLMVPFTYTFPTSVLCYWTANNTFSLMQSALFRNKGVKKALGIWEPPKPVPGAPPPKGIMDMINDYGANNEKKRADARAKEKIEMHNAAVEKKMMDRAKGRNGRRRRK